MSEKKIYKIGIIGIEHTHLNLLYNKFNSLCGDRIEWIGFAEIEEAKGAVKEFNERIYDYLFKGVKRYDNYIELLEQKPDIVIVCSDIKMHAEICEETLKRNIHTIVEKPMAINFDDGVKMYEAANKSKAELVINWPIAWLPAFVKAKELLDSGIIGKPLRCVYRTPHTWGPFGKDTYSDDELSQFWWYDKNRGGGSVLDYACYGCALTAWIFGEELPKRVVGVKKNFLTNDMLAEDYGKFIIEYENGVAEVEGSWSTAHGGEVPTGPVIYGAEGTIVTDRYFDQVRVYKTNATEPEIYATDNDSVDIPVNFINHIENNEPLREMVSLELNMRAMAMLDACVRAAETSGVADVKKW